MCAVHGRRRRPSAHRATDDNPMQGSAAADCQCSPLDGELSPRNRLAGPDRPFTEAVLPICPRQGRQVTRPSEKETLSNRDSSEAAIRYKCEINGKFEDKYLVWWIIED